MYIEEIGIIRAKESTLLTFTDYERLVNMISYKDLYAELIRLNLGYQELPYSKIKSNISSNFSKNIIFVYKEIISLIKNEEIKKALLYEADFFNLKLIFKSKFYNDKRFLDGLIDLGFIGKSNIINFIEKDILPFINEKNFDLSYIFVIIKNFNHDLSPFDFDIFLDRILMKFRLNLTKNNDFLKDLCKKSIDFLNINLFLNNSSTYLDFGYISKEEFSNMKIYNYEEKLNIFKKYDYEKIANILFNDKKIDFLNFELEKEKILLNISKQSIFFNFSIEPIICYLIKKLSEIKTIHRILSIKAFLGNSIEKESKIIQIYK